MRRRAACLAAVLVLGAVSATAQDLDRDGVPFPADCNDGNSDAGSNDVERCDGFDNDCDGVVDEGCPAVCESPRAAYERTFADGAIAARGMRATASATAWNVAWIDDRDGQARVYAQRFSEDGRPTGLVYPVSSTTSVDPSAVDIHSGGDWSGVVWEDRAFGNVDIAFARYAGFPDPPAIPVTIEPADQVEPAITWMEDRWAVAYAFDDGFGTFSIQLREVLDDATVNPAAMLVSGPGANGREPDIAFSAGNLGVVWLDRRGADSDIYFRAVNKDLTPAGPEIVLAATAEAEVLPAIAPAGAGFAVAWIEGQGGTPRFKAMLIDGAGVPVAPAVTLSTSTMNPGPPRVATTGDEVLVSWSDAPLGTPQLLLARIGYDGVLRQSQHGIADLQVADAVDLVWNGTAVALVDPAAGDSLRVLHVECCGDFDGDGFDRCIDDCDDRSSAIGPGATELCDGIDRDCDGEVDDVAGCVRVCDGPDLDPAAIRHGFGSGPYFGDVDLAWDGIRVAAVWEEGGAADTPEEISFQLLHPDGSPAAPALSFSDDESPLRRPMIAPAPDGWFLSYNFDLTAQGEVLRLDPNGQPLGDPVRLPTIYNSGFRQQLLADSRGFAQMHRSSGTEFVRFLPDGTQLREEFQALENHLDATLAWNGSRYAVIGVRSDLRAIEGVLIDAEGRILDDPKTLVDGPNFIFSSYVAWNGRDGEYALVYDQSGNLQFQRFDADLDPVGINRSIAGGANLHDPIIVWNGAEYLVQWEDESLDRVRAARVDRSGNRIGDLIELVDVSDGTMEWRLRDDVIAVGGSFLSAWSVQTGSTPGMYTRSIGCCANGDPDGDGSCLNDCDESDPDRFPGNVEVCDQKDNDCDGVLPPEEVEDIDGDGVPVCRDCDDTNPNRYPGAPELCNMIDDNCDDVIPGEGPFEIVGGLRFLDPATLVWDAVPFGAFYDLQRGDLASLRGSNGDFTTAVDTCVVFNTTSRSRFDPETPATGQGFFYNVAGGSQQCPGTFESGGAGQSEARDPEFYGSSALCP